MIQECEKSLQRMNTDYIDILAIHWPLATTPIEETMEGFDQLIKKGKIRFAGICNFSKPQMEELLQFGSIISHQLRYNLLERDNENEIIPYCLEKNIGIQAYSPLAHGLLAGEFGYGDSLKKDDWRSRYTLFEKSKFDKIMDLLEKLKVIAYDHNCTLSNLALNWILNQRGVTTAIVGMRHPQHVNENIKAVDCKFDESDFKEINVCIQESDLGLTILSPEEYMDKTK